MVRGNLGAALQGFVALPLLVGYDLDDSNPQGRTDRVVRRRRRLDIEEEGYQSVGSGSISPSRRSRSSIPLSSMLIRRCGGVEALSDAADDDSATGGPDLVRASLTAVTIEADGAADVPEQRISALAREVIEKRSRANSIPARQRSQQRSTAGGLSELPIFHLA